MRRRSREINIFNMSLLDILCGALGAFCFMMLVLMPYYKPPGQEVDVQKKQQEIQDALKKLEEMKDHLTDANAARDLEELVKKLQAQIQELQGRLNQALAEIDQLKQRLNQLQQERDQAVAERNQAVTERDQAVVQRNQALALNEQLQKEKQQLLARNQQLEQERQQLQRRIDQLTAEKEKLQQQNNMLQQRQPFLVRAIAKDPAQDVGLYVLDPAIYKSAEGKESSAQAPFNPHLLRQPVVFPGDISTWYAGHGMAIWAIREVVPRMRLKVYINLANIKDQAPTTVHVDTQQSPDVYRNFPDVPLTLEHPWIYVGEIFGDPDKTHVLREATPEEREQEWKQIGSSVGPESKPTEPGSGGPHGPGSGPFPFDRDHRRVPRQDNGPNQAERTNMAIAAIEIRLGELRANPAKDRKGAEAQQTEIANLEEKLKVLKASRELPDKK